MKNIKSFIRSFLLIILLFIISSTVIAQKNTRLSFQVAPLYSYMDVKYGQYANRNNPGIKDPLPGLSSALKFEVDLNNLLSVSAGLSFERRKNSYETELYDRSDTVRIIRLGDLPPYKMTTASTYDYIGIPIELHVNYLNHSKLRIYQTFGTECSFLISAKGKGVRYYEKKGAINYTGNAIDDKTAVIVSLSSSIGVYKYITDRVAIKIEPGINYMVNNFYESSWAKLKYFDFKVDVGIVYNLYSKKD